MVVDSLRLLLPILVADLDILAHARVVVQYLWPHLPMQNEEGNHRHNEYQVQYPRSIEHSHAAGYVLRLGLNNAGCIVETGQIALLPAAEVQ